jgi:hypothetical protein
MPVNVPVTPAFFVGVTGVGVLTGVGADVVAFAAGVVGVAVGVVTEVEAGVSAEVVARVVDEGFATGDGAAVTGAAELFVGVAELFAGAAELFVGVAELFAGAAELFAGVFVGALAEVVGEVTKPELDVPPTGAPLPSVKPPALPNCGGVMDTTAPKPPIAPPTIKRKRLPIISQYSLL